MWVFEGLPGIRCGLVLGGLDRDVMAEVGDSGLDRCGIPLKDGVLKNRMTLDLIQYES